MAVKKRKTPSKPPPPPPPSTKPLSPSPPPPSNTADMPGLLEILRRQPLWIILAVSSGACAALNGVFAKLTTTTLTSTLSSSLATLLGLPANNTPIDLLVRAFFFAMNLTFNALMWALFTAALTRGDSTTRVSVVNVSSNFMVTALLGLVIFGERLPPLWWVGAGLLAAGNVVIGRREEEGKGKGKGETGGMVGVGGEGREEAEGLLGGEGEREGDLLELDEDLVGAGGEEEDGDRRRLRKGEDADAPI